MEYGKILKESSYIYQVHLIIIFEVTPIYLKFSFFAKCMPALGGCGLHH